jgi:hypothetical protein
MVPPRIHVNERSPREGRCPPVVNDAAEHAMQEKRDCRPKLRLACLPQAENPCRRPTTPNPINPVLSSLA